MPYPWIEHEVTVCGSKVVYFKGTTKFCYVSGAEKAHVGDYGLVSCFSLGIQE